MHTADIPIIELSGTPRVRGRVYGEAARSSIANVVACWRSGLDTFSQDGDSKKGTTVETYLNDFFSQSNYLSAISAWAPGLLDEVKGIAEGSGQALRDILGLQLIDEEWIFGLRRRLDKPTTKCTAFGVPDQAEGVSYAGQNMDVPSWVDGNQVLLRVMSHRKDSDNIEVPEAMMFSVAGNIGLNGLNASGLGVTCNTLPQLNYSVCGLPVAFIVRSLLEKHSIDQAEQFLHAIPHASGQNYILSSSGDMRCFECCSTGVERYLPAEYQGSVFHTNHPLVSQDTSELLEHFTNRSENSEARLNSICHRLGEASHLLTLEDIKAALAAHDDRDNPVSRNINKAGSAIGFTAGASIYEFSDKPRLHLAAGPPCQTDFLTFDFKQCNSILTYK
jgi:isopenicillin-N N-acyltransferase-like protein